MAISHEELLSNIKWYQSNDGRYFLFSLFDSENKQIAHFTLGHNVRNDSLYALGPCIYETKYKWRSLSYDGKWPAIFAPTNPLFIEATNLVVQILCSDAGLLADVEANLPRRQYSSPAVESNPDLLDDVLGPVIESAIEPDSPPWDNVPVPEFDKTSVLLELRTVREKINTLGRDVDYIIMKLEI